MGVSKNLQIESDLNRTSEKMIDQSGASVPRLDFFKPKTILRLVG